MLVYLFSVFVSIAVKRIRILKTLENNNGKWKVRINLDLGRSTNLVVDRINPISGKKYQRKESRETQEKQTFIEIVYTLIIAPGFKSKYTTKTFLYSPC